MLIELKQTSFKPGETLEGKAMWDEPGPGMIELAWSTLGRGEPETVVVAGSTLPSPGAFSFTLPLSPWSVTGKLLKIKWAVRLTVGELKTQHDFTLSPTGGEYSLGQSIPDVKPQ